MIEWTDAMCAVPPRTLGGMRVSHGGLHQSERGGLPGPERAPLGHVGPACIFLVCSPVQVYRASHTRSCRRGPATSSTHLGRANGHVPHREDRPGSTALRTAHP